MAKSTKQTKRGKRKRSGRKPAGGGASKSSKSRAPKPRAKRQAKAPTAAKPLPKVARAPALELEGAVRAPRSVLFDAVCLNEDNRVLASGVGAVEAEQRADAHADETGHDTDWLQR